MRDGIFKRMPQSRQWRGMWQSCNRAAEREGIARAKAERALLGDLKKEMRAKFTANFLDRCLQTETVLPLPGVRFFGETMFSRELGGENSPLEQSTLRHARRLEEGGMKGAELATESVACAHQEWADRQMRQMTQFCIDEAGYTDRPTIDAARLHADARLRP